MSETNIVFSIKSTYPVSTCILCHLSAFEADSKRFRRVSVIRDSTVKCNERPNSISAMLEARNGINLLKSSLVSQFLYRIKVEMQIYPASATPTQLKPYHVCEKDFLSSQLASEISKDARPERHGHIERSNSTLGN